MTLLIIALSIFFALLVIFLIFPFILPPFIIRLLGDKYHYVFLLMMIFVTAGKE